MFGVDMKIVGDDGARTAVGRHRVRRPARARAVGHRRATSRDEGVDALVDGWFPTGDVATIDRDGFMQHHRPQQGRHQVGRRVDQLDRPGEHRDGASGGGGGGVHRRARIRSGTSGRCSSSCKRPGRDVTREEMLAFYEGKVAKWWIPDDVVFVDELPHTATGKLQKNSAARAVPRSRAADASQKSVCRRRRSETEPRGLGNLTRTVKN